jgi:hypothetical protein
MNYNVSATTSAQSVLQDLGTINGHFTLAGVGSVMGSYLACLPTDYTLDFCRSQVLSPFRSVYVDAAVATPGTFPALASTGNLQHAITLHTANGGRDQIAVKKIGPAPDGTYAGGAPDPAYKAGPLLALAGVLISQRITLGVQITLDPIVKHPNNTGQPVVGYRLPDRTGTMRRRTLRVGE